MIFPDGQGRFVSTRKRKSGKHLQLLNIITMHMAKGHHQELKNPVSAGGLSKWMCFVEFAVLLTVPPEPSCLVKQDSSG